MAYTVTFKASALKQAEKLPKDLARRVLDAASALASNPRPHGCTKLAGSSGFWRIRVGDYRIVYLIDDANRGVDVRIIANRREVYRGM